MNQEQVQLVTSLVEQVCESFLAKKAQDQGNDAEMAPTPNSDDYDEEEVSWGTILQPKASAPTSEEAKRFVQVLASPPPLTDLKKNQTLVPRFSGVPETPPPRRNKVDNQLFMVQSKLETSLHLLTGYFENNNPSQLGAAAAWIRSAWQDTHEARRQYVAGRQSWKLDQRTDDDRPRLLSREEEKKIKPRFDSSFKKPPPKFTPDSSSRGRSEFPSRWRPKERSQSRGRYSGKGKGKQK